MNKRNSLKGLLLGIMLLVAAGSFAAEKASLTIYDNVMIGGKQVKAGDYVVEWDGASPNVQVNFLRGKTVVASTTARMADKGTGPQSNTYDAVTNTDGSRTVTAIQFHGKKFALELGDAGTAVAGNNAK